MDSSLPHSHCVFDDNTPADNSSPHDSPHDWPAIAHHLGHTPQAWSCPLHSRAQTRRTNVLPDVERPGFQPQGTSPESHEGKPRLPCEVYGVGHRLGQRQASLQAGVETGGNGRHGGADSTRAGWLMTSVFPLECPGWDRKAQGGCFKASITQFLRTKIILFYLYINNCFLEQAQRNETQIEIMLKMFTYFLSEDIRLALSVGGICNLRGDNIILLILQYIFHIFAAKAD